MCSNIVQCLEYSGAVIDILCSIVKYGVVVYYNAVLWWEEYKLGPGLIPSWSI